MTSIASSLPIKHIKLKVLGRVQGVGFRPFVYQLAHKLKLLGSVANHADGVVIHLQGKQNSIEQFQQQLALHPPKQARIQSIQSEKLPIIELTGFDILNSQSLKQNENTQIAPDIATCASCLAEFHDPENRRYHDPFINCSDCGPRYTILRNLPYDRSHSAMNEYVMCESCSAEYQEPTNRRYHTQGICCSECGPKISLFDSSQNRLAQGEQAIQQVANLLKTPQTSPGQVDFKGLVAFKGIGGFHILCNALDNQAVKLLREHKQRSAKPFAVLCKDLKMAQQFAQINQHEAALLSSDAKPIVLLKKRTDSILSEWVAPDIQQVGLFLANTPLQHLLFEYIDQPLIATSANLGGEPIIYQTDILFKKLCRKDRPVVEFVLDYDREIFHPCDDSIVQSVAGKVSTLRLSRGLAPLYGECENQFCHKNQESVLSVGAQQKSSFAFMQNNQWMLSPYLGDLSSLASQQRFQQTIEELQTLCHFNPQKIVSDLHPGYISSVWAAKTTKQLDIPYKTVQHHYAHVLACMAEHNLNQPVIAFSWDGTGMGDDDTIWGGEVLLADRDRYQRVLHLKPFKLLGGDQANQQPRRVALALLFEQFCLDEIVALDSPTVKAFTQTEIEQLHQMYQQNLNSPLTSSIGRLFDGMASLLGLKQILDYEGQSGLLLESFYDDRVSDSYDYQIENGQIDIQPMIKRMLIDQQEGMDLSDLVSRFFNLLANVIEQIAEQYIDLPVIVTGGVFQNKTLLNLLIQRFVNKDQRLYLQQQTPVNDGSIALGQLWCK